MINIGRWFRKYSRPITLECGQNQCSASGIIVPQEQSISFNDYPQPSPSGMIEYDKYIAYFIYLGGVPSEQPSMLQDGNSSYLIDKVEFIQLMDCWRASLREVYNE